MLTTTTLTGVRVAREPRQRAEADVVGGAVAADAEDDRQPRPLLIAELPPS